VLIIDLAQRFCWIVEGCGISLLRSLQDLSSKIFFKIFESLLRDLGEVQIIITGALLSSPVFNDQCQKWGKEHRPFSFEQPSYQGLEYFKLRLIVQLQNVFSGICALTLSHTFYKEHLQHWILYALCK